MLSSPWEGNFGCAKFWITENSVISRKYCSHCYSSCGNWTWDCCNFFLTFPSHLCTHHLEKEKLWLAWMRDHTLCPSPADCWQGLDNQSSRMATSTTVRTELEVCFSTQAMGDLVGQAVIWHLQCSAKYPWLWMGDLVWCEVLLPWEICEYAQEFVYFWWNLQEFVSDLLHPHRNRQGSRARVSQESLNHHVTVCSTYGGPVKMSQFQMPENKFEVVSILHANRSI